MPTRKALGKRLRSRREEVGLTQAQVAEQLGVAQETISRWEAGLTKIGLDELALIARLYRAPMGWLLAGEGSAPEPYREIPERPKDGLTPVTRQGAEKRKGRA